MNEKIEQLAKWSEGSLERGICVVFSMMQVVTAIIFYFVLSLSNVYLDFTDYDNLSVVVTVELFLFLTIGCLYLERKVSQ